MGHKAQYEIADGRWYDSYKAVDTVGFVTDDAVKGINRETRRYYEDGFRVFP